MASHLYAVPEQAAVLVFSDGYKAFSSPVSSHTQQSHSSKCQCCKGNKNPKRNKFHMDQCTAQRNNFVKFGDNGLSQWNSPKYSVLLWTAGIDLLGGSSSVPCLAEPPASASWGDAGLPSCTVALAMLQLCFGKHLKKAMAKSHCGICMGHPSSCSWLFHSLPFPATCDMLPKLCSSSLWKKIGFCLFSLLYSLANKLLTLCWHFIMYTSSSPMHFISLEKCGSRRT